MPQQIADRVKEVSTTTGTGALTLAGAAIGYRTFASVCSVSDTFYYAIEGVNGDGTLTGQWEVGLGTYSGVNTLTRTSVLASSNANAAVNFSAGTKQVWIDAAAAALIALAPLASPVLTGTPTAPTATPGTSTTQLATTGFVQSALYSPLDGMGENIFFNKNAPEWSVNSSATVDNGDGTFTINTTLANTTYNAQGRLAVGKKVSLAVRAVTGSVVVATTFIRFRDAGVATISTALVSTSADQDGYFNVENVTVPANTVTILVQADPLNSGDRLEVVFVPAPYTYGARSNNTSTPVFSRGPAQGNSAPYRLLTVGQAVEAIAAPNGTVAVWNSLVTARGAAPVSATLTALRKVERWLTSSGLIHKLVYLNLRCGNTLAAALTPFLDKFGFGYDEAPTSFSSWTEATGLSGVTVNTGIDPNRAGLNQFGMAMGFYNRANVASDGNNYCIGNAGSGGVGTYGICPCNANLMLYDYSTGGRVQGDIRLINGDGSTTLDSLGGISGARCIDGIGRVSRRGIVLATNNALPTAEIATLPLLVDANPQISGGDWVGAGMWTADDTVAMEAMLHTFNSDLGRAVTAEGAF